MSSIIGPSDDQAFQFAIILSSGIPPREAIPYFYPDTPPEDFPAILKLWFKSAAVSAAIEKVQGKRWQEMSLEERVKYAIEKQYSEMAYFLYSRNYAEITGSDKQKADTCRTTLEAKLAGMAGKMNSLEQFYADMASGKVK